MEDRLRRIIPDRARWLALSLVIISASAAWVWSSVVPDSETTGGRIPSPREGFLAPDFTLDLLTGGQMTLSDQQGKVVIINFWASWCPPCKMVEPLIDDLSTELNEKVKIGKMNVDQNPSRRAEYDILGVPTFIIFKDGKEVERRVGAQSKEQLRDLVQKGGVKL